VLSDLVLLTSGLAVGQLSARFYLEKTNFAPGEPVFLYSEIKNGGSEPLNIPQAHPYSFCSGYEIHLSSDEKTPSFCGMAGWAGSCLSSDIELKPGQKRVDRILLNFEHKINAEGEYDIQAHRSLSYAQTGTDFYPPPKLKLEVFGQFHIRVDSSAELDPHLFDTLIAQLRGTDLNYEATEAARTLASLAPKSLEETLLGLAYDPHFKHFAPLAFHRLNTPRSMAALADLLSKSEIGSTEHLDSAKYLAESGDPQWFPLLLAVAQEKPTILNYVEDAAESDGAKMLPYLVAWMQSQDDQFTKPNAVSAMAFTGSREAVPVLIELLKSPDLSISQRARLGLRQLTHFNVGGEQWVDPPQSQYSRWLQWWATNGATAHVYKANECADVRPLP
jgi:hypothetical protein